MCEGDISDLRILLVEDNLINQKVAKKMLKKLGYDADLAINGKEAIQALESRPYQIVFMDIQMPEMDGLEATRIIRKRWQIAEQPHIVALTAYGLEYSKELCLSAGMDDYLSKPVRVEELRAAIDCCVYLKSK
jgi:CheY-like chemotaxis protein